jgi:hypothetical protein
LLPPVKGIHQGVVVDKTPPLTSGDMNNVRPTDVLENRLRIGQRPGQDKAYTQQIGGAAFPIVEIVSVTIID